MQQVYKNKKITPRQRKSLKKYLHVLIWLFWRRNVNWQALKLNFITA